MTPYSAAAEGSFDSLSSSRRACLSTSSGRPALSMRSRSSLISAWVSSVSPSSSWMALSCCRSTYSRWFLSISDCTWSWIFEPSSRTSSSRFMRAVRRRRRLRQLDLFQQILLLLGLEAHGGGDEVAQNGRVVDAGGRHLQLVGQVGHQLDDLGVDRDQVPLQGLQLGPLLDHVGEVVDLGLQVRLLGDEALDLDAAYALGDDAQRPVGGLDHLLDAGQHADVVDVVWVRGSRCPGPWTPPDPPACRPAGCRR